MTYKSQNLALHPSVSMQLLHLLPYVQPLQGESHTMLRL